MPQGLTPAQRAIRARIGALALHAKHDVHETSLPGRVAFLERFEREVDPDGVLPLEERQRRAGYARKAYFQKLVLQRELKKSAKKKRQAAEARITSATRMSTEAEVQVDATDRTAATA